MNLYMLFLAIRISITIVTEVVLKKIEGMFTISISIPINIELQSRV